MKKLQYILIALFIAFICALPAIAPPSDAIDPPNYVASVKRAPFHDMNCRSVGMITELNARFYHTRDAAIIDGHRPCKLCKP